MKKNEKFILFNKSKFEQIELNFRFVIITANSPWNMLPKSGKK